MRRELDKHQANLLHVEAVSGALWVSPRRGTHQRPDSGLEIDGTVK